MLYMSPSTLLAAIDSMTTGHTTRCEVLALRDNAYSQFYTDAPASEILAHITDVEKRFKIVKWRWRKLWNKIDRKWRIAVMEQCAPLYANAYDNDLFDRAIAKVKEFPLLGVNSVKEAHDFINTHRDAFDTTSDIARAKRAASVAVATITHFQETHSAFCRYAAIALMYARSDYDARIEKKEGAKLEALLGAMIAEAMDTETEESVLAIDLARP